MRFADGIDWVIVVNRVPVRNVSAAFVNGEKCVVDYEGSFFDTRIRRKGLVIIRYRGPKDYLYGGTPCGNGTMFAVSRATYALLIAYKVRVDIENYEQMMYEQAKWRLLNDASVVYPSFFPRKKLPDVLAAFIYHKL